MIINTNLLFDVMQYYDAGKSIYQLCEIFNLTPLQVKTAIAYIDKHRSALEPELAKAIAYRKERETYHRQLAAERWEKIAQLPMTPLRAAVYAILEKNRGQLTEWLMQTVLSDHNCEGQAEAIFQALQHQGFLPFLPMQLLLFTHVRLHIRSGDREVWQFCQDNGHLLLNFGRNRS